MTNNENTNNNNFADEMLGLIADICGPNVAEAIKKDIESGAVEVTTTPFGGCITNMPRRTANPVKPTNTAKNENNQKDCKCHSDEHNHEHKCDCKNDVNDHKCTCASHFTYGATNVVLEKDGTRVITMLLPGYKKENIHVSYLGKVLTITASDEKETVADGIENGELTSKVVKEEYKRPETVTKQFSYENAVYKQTTLAFEDGILTVRIPARAEETPKEITFE